jgi:hypothetical protein
MYYILVVSFLVVSVGAGVVGAAVVSVGATAVESVAVVSEPLAFSCELQPEAMAPIMAVANANVKMCFFIKYQIKNLFVSIC